MLFMPYFSFQYKPKQIKGIKILKDNLFFLSLFPLLITFSHRFPYLNFALFPLTLVSSDDIKVSAAHRTKSIHEQSVFLHVVLETEPQNMRIDGLQTFVSFAHCLEHCETLAVLRCKMAHNHGLLFLRAFLCACFYCQLVCISTEYS